MPAAEYLSGNVRAKLAAAERAVAMDTSSGDARGADVGGSRYEVNVTALRAVIPPDLGPGEIDARLGAAWIGPADVQTFLRELLDDPRLEVDRIVGSDWMVRPGPGARYGVAATEAWGTERYPAQRVAESLLRQTQIRVNDELEDGTRVLNPTETTAAVEKAREMSDRFAEWVWEDPSRAGRLARVYNETFNAIRLRSYDDAGATLSLPGLAVTFTPRPHQRAAVARMIAEPAVGLFHEVGAGKTAEMVIGAMELRRLGMVAKPAIVVPNHMLEQFAREALQLYPQARVLAAGAEDLARDRRRAFLARVSTGDPDLVVLTRTAFAALPLSADEQRRYVESELTPLREALAARSGDNSLAVKRIERMLLAREESMKARIGAMARDGGLTFELTGIDYLLVDELHDYKNLATASNIPDANITGSARASDLHMKIAYLRRVNGERVVTGATATPIANSVTEAYVMQRYLRPDLLADAGIADFDTWAATFGATVTELEMSPDGGSWRPKTRFAKFRNVPELLTQWHVSADVKTAADLGLPTPDLWVRPDGRRAAETVVIAAPEEVRAYVAALGERAERIRGRAVDPSEDNMLKLTSDGRKAALDMRLVDPTLPGAETGKISVAAGRIAAIYAEHRDRTYLGGAGEEHPRRGAFQLVFCDLGTPGDPRGAARGERRWNAYDALRAELVARGVPGESIRYIHEADTDAKKAALFAQCRTGGVAVLIGSTAKMGVGTNVQARAVALHHLDCPWRPADLAQRDGRILRQGNQNPEVGIYRYVVEGSFDAYSWQTVERKAKFIGQIMTGRLDTREIDDVGESAALSFNEVKALASGNPLLLEAAEADAEAGRLERLARAHQRGQRMLAQTITDSTSELAAVSDALAATETAIARRVDTRADAFAITLHGRWHAERPAAAADLPDLLTAAALGPDDHPVPLGEIGGQDLQARPDRHRTGRGAVRVHVGVRGNDVVINADDLAAASRSNSAALGLLARLERAVSSLDGHHRALATRQERLTAEIRTAQGRLGTAFPHTEALATAKARQATIAAALTAQTADRDPAPVPSAAPVPGPGRVAEQRAQLHAALAQIEAAQTAEREGPGYNWDGIEAPGIDRDPGIGL